MVVYEQDFDDEVAGAVPDGWTDTVPTRPAEVFEVHTGQYVSSPHSLYLEANSASTAPYRGRDIVVNTEDTFYFAWRVKNHVKQNLFVFQSTTGEVDGAQISAQIYIYDTKFQYYDGALKDTGIVTATDTWYKMKLVFDWSAYTFDWYVWDNGTSTWDTISVDAGFRNNVQYIRSIHVVSVYGTVSGLYLDNLQLGEGPLRTHVRFDNQSFTGTNSVGVKFS